MVLRQGFRHEAAAFALGNVHVDPRAMDVVHEKLAAIFRGPVVTLINHQARVRVAAAHRAAARITGVRTFVAGVVDMVGNGLDVFINVREDRQHVEMKA